ncbi:arsenic transporter [Metallosphaera cuprina]|uniref:Arsenical pump membrane protein n=2 Tax=Metallosphaera TaxID=41980 RepID=F4G225_METCR|nr:arsenic transporter [Metallosphaera cuprina]AEB96102.1 arsenical pump membrane protein [Metallosphaera cuprina Ar-4]
MLIVSFVIFLATLAMVIIRPRNIGIGYSAIAGAVASLLLGITTVRDVYIVWGIVWNATFTFVAVIIASLIFDEAGFFEYAAVRIAKFANGNGLKLFVLIIVLGAGISAVFANDGTALILTPIVYTLLTRVGVDKKHVVPFIMATGFIADSASLPLVVSNLVNIVTASYFSISFLDYARVMILPDLMAIIASLAFMLLYFKNSIPYKYDVKKLDNPEDAIKDPLTFRLAMPTIILLIISYSIGGIYNVPVAFIAVPVVAVLFLVARINGKINTNRILRVAPWQIVIFSLGMYLVVFGLGREGFTEILFSLLATFSKLGGPFPTLLSGYLFALIAATMNNMPSVMIGNLAISRFTDPASLIYANVIGNDIGPKFTPIGSLATLLWLYTLDRKGGIKISAMYYMKIGFLIAIPVLSFSLLALWLVTT